VVRAVRRKTLPICTHGPRSICRAPGWVGLIRLPVCSPGKGTSRSPALAIRCRSARHGSCHSNMEFLAHPEADLPAVAGKASNHGGGRRSSNIHSPSRASGRPRVTKPTPTSSGIEIETLATSRADLKRGDVRLTMGGRADVRLYRRHERPQSGTRSPRVRTNTSSATNSSSAARSLRPERLPASRPRQMVSGGGAAARVVRTPLAAKDRPPDLARSTLIGDDTKPTTTARRRREKFITQLSCVWVSTRIMRFRGSNVGTTSGKERRLPVNVDPFDASWKQAGPRYGWRRFSSGALKR